MCLFIKSVPIEIKVVYRSIQIEKGVPTYATINSNTNTAYVSYTSSDFVTVLSLEKGTIENKIQLSNPGNIAINLVTNKAYVSFAYGICEIDRVNNHDIVNVGLPHSDGSVDINPQRNLLYTTCFGHDILTVIDTASRSIVDKIPVGKAPKGVAVDTSTNKIYVANSESYSVSVIDSFKSNEITDTITFEGKVDSSTRINPNAVLVNEKPRLLYVTTDYLSAIGAAWQGKVLYVIDIGSKGVLNFKSLPSNNKTGFAFNPNSNAIYMMRRGERSILKFDSFGKESLETMTLERSSIWRRIFGIDYGYFAEVIAVNPSTNKLYVSDSKNNVLYEIDA